MAFDGVATDFYVIFARLQDQGCSMLAIQEAQDRCFPYI